jgi:photosystem II stability/assembly factor-like uncharacterized protein
MRYAFPLTFVLLASPALAQPPVAFDDAAIHAVQFVDASEGWAVGDDGVIWHSIDGGKNWERQKSGTRASLRGVHFQTPYTGWAVGRTERPNGGGSVGVMLRTTDGGLTWDEVGTNMMPGLHGVRFADEKRGFVCGDGSDAFPSGMFSTTDGGETWNVVKGPRSPGWRSTNLGFVAGAWSKLGRYATGEYNDADIDPLSGRSLHSVAAASAGFLLPVYAVGDGGAVLSAANERSKWGFVNLGLSPATLSNCDFKCVAAVGTHVWVAGRPGGFVLHSGDYGKTWEVQKTGIAVPANGMFFLDDKTGWVVGELGTVLATSDGGKTWGVQRLGGQRAAALFLHANGRSTPLETIASLGHGEGYFCAAVSFTSADPTSADPKRAGDAMRLRAAMRTVGGVTAESAWAFPMPSHAEGLSPRDLMASWDAKHGGKAADQLLRQTVLAIRIWQPEVMITDVVATDAKPADVLMLHAAKEAFKQAADPAAFPEQITELGLKPWAAKKLYAMGVASPQAPVRHDHTEFHKALGDSPKDFAEGAVRVLAGESEKRRGYVLISHRLQGAEAHTELMQGVSLPHGGGSRRAESASTSDLEALAERQKAVQTRQRLEGLAVMADAELGGADKIMASLGAELPKMPDDIAARTAYAVGQRFAAVGKWAEAREVFGVLVVKYPGHPLAIEGFRWLTRYHASSEARRRAEILEKLTIKNVKFEPTPVAAGGVMRASGNSGPSSVPVQHEDVYRAYSPEMIARWHQACLDFQPKLSAFGPVHSRDPAAWLSFLAARRHLGQFAEADKFVMDYFKNAPGAASMPPGTDHWRDCLAAEMWLTNKSAIPLQPKPIAFCRATDAKPFLDGKLDDACWKNHPAMTLKGTPGDAYKTEASFAYDAHFLYVAVKCSHPEGEQAAPVGKRTRDADMTGRDRIDILLDMDRDYQTYYRFQIDARGCLAEDCWGDKTWNPKYFVAFHPEPTGWTAEVAIPLTELTGAPPSHGKAWAVNVSRVLPGKGVLSWSGPADAEVRPEGMGVMQFRSDK